MEYRQIGWLRWRLLFVCLLTAGLLGGLATSSANGSLPPQWTIWKTIGTSTLRWGFWDVYDARLVTPSGQFNPQQWQRTEMALIIQYRMDIRSKSLVSATDDQWRHLKIPAQQRKPWLDQLATLLPDIRKGDQLSFVMLGATGRLYSGNRLIGEIKDVEIGAGVFGDLVVGKHQLSETQEAVDRC